MRVTESTRKETRKLRVCGRAFMFTCVCVCVCVYMWRVCGVGVGLGRCIHPHRITPACLPCSALAGFVWYQFALSNKSGKPTPGGGHVHHHAAAASTAAAKAAAAPLLGGAADLEKGIGGGAGMRAVRTAAGGGTSPSKE